MRYIFLLLLIGIGIQAQIRQLKNPNGNSDSIVVDNGGKDSVKIFKPTIQDYRYKTQFQEAKIFDTAFSVHRQYAITQYNNRDNFGKIQFANIGSGFQNLVFQRDEETDLSLLPERKSHFILGVKDIRYYDVKTPTTSFIYHSGMRNGAALQSTYTQNFGKNFNLAVEYMGLRSQGFYSNSLAANNNFVASAHYRSVNQKYEAYAHYLHQNVMNQEYGGVKSLDAFLSGESTLGNRANLEVGLTGSDSRFSYRRYYFSHSFTPFNAEKFPFRLSHTIFHQGNKYYFNLGGSDASFFEAVNTERGNSSKKYSKKLSNTISLVFDNEKFKLDAGARYQNIILGAENPVVNTDIIAGKEISENRIGVVGNLKISLWEQLKLQSHLEYSNGKQFGNFLRTTNWLNFEPIKDYFVEGKVAFQSSTPTFNYLLNASSIMSYNYDF
ncbi:MAG: hypothetical protein Q4C75_03010, partial [Bergeyella zoohelcum]|nr:hypothetical protein [Bergeyella zoohelcum]